MKFRHEWKHEITPSDMMTLRARLRTVAKSEKHGINGLCNKLQTQASSASAASAASAEKESNNEKHRDGILRHNVFRLNFIKLCKPAF